MENPLAEKALVNRVAQSGIETIDLEQFFPKSEIVPFDLKPFLFMELMLKEKDFRASMADIDWSVYGGKILALYCSSDAIIPMWAYMLVAVLAAPFATEVVEGNVVDVLRLHYAAALNNFDLSFYEGKRIVIKGCGSKPVPAFAYAAITKLLQPTALSIMYGEPCSMVPIFKRKG